MGGYKPILPYAADDKPINVWFYDQQGREVYFQGLFVKDVDQPPKGYTLMRFPAATTWPLPQSGWRPTRRPWARPATSMPAQRLPPRAGLESVLKLRNAVYFAPKR